MNIPIPIHYYYECQLNVQLMHAILRRHGALFQSKHGGTIFKAVTVFMTVQAMTVSFLRACVCVRVCRRVYTSRRTLTDGESSRKQRRAHGGFCASVQIRLMMKRLFSSLRPSPESVLLASRLTPSTPCLSSRATNLSVRLRKEEGERISHVHPH